MNCELVAGGDAPPVLRAIQGEAAWVGELDAGTVIPLARPGANPRWRVAVEEWEQLPGDPPSSAEAPPGAVALPVWEQRLIYADEVPL